MSFVSNPVYAVCSYICAQLCLESKNFLDWLGSSPKVGTQFKSIDLKNAMLQNMTKACESISDQNHVIQFISTKILLRC